MPNTSHSDIQLLRNFLKTDTPLAWIETALKNLPLLMVDHAHCERKAAATAINFMSKYPELAELVDVMSPLAREELLHFEKVLQLLQKRNIAFGSLQSCNYAQKMHKHVTPGGCRARLVDQLIIGAIIEARSCERFWMLVSHLEDEELSRFYQSLLRSEARHFQDYLKLANLYGEDISARVDYFLNIENALILASDDFFRFHSGIPI